MKTLRRLTPVVRALKINRVAPLRDVDFFTDGETVF